MLKEQDFPIVMSLLRENRRPHFLMALNAVMEGSANGSIRKAVLDDSKSVLSRLVEEVWEAGIRDPFLVGKIRSYPPMLQDLLSEVRVYGLHDVLSSHKKLVKTKVEGEVVVAMRAILAEWLPLAETVSSLKDKVVKGRMPVAETPRMENPDKNVKTCPCCFRGIAISGGKMVHHGYERPGTGYQTASCSGIMFAPLEFSTEGLVWSIMETETLLAKNEKRKETVESSDFSENLFVPDRLYPFSRPMVEVEKGSPQWDKARLNVLGELGNRNISLKADIVFRKKTLKDWEKWHESKTSEEIQSKSPRKRSNSILGP